YRTQTHRLLSRQLRLYKEVQAALLIQAELAGKEAMRLRTVAGPPPKAHLRLGVTAGPVPAAEEAPVARRMLKRPQQPQIHLELVPSLRRLRDVLARRLTLAQQGQA